MADAGMMKTVGIVQLDVRYGDVATNVREAVRHLHMLGEEGVALAVLPELWSCGFDYENLRDHGHRTPDILARLSDIARTYGMMVAGSLPETDRKDVYNTLYLHERDGRVCGSYRKIHLFRYAGEERGFTGGNRAVVCRTSLGRLGMLICYDLRFPELGRTLALGGARVIVVSAQWPASRIHHWDALLKARAIENQLFIIAANRRGRDRTNAFSGHSQIVSPLGEIVAMGNGEAAVIHAEIDMSQVDLVRSAMPCLEERQPDAYEC